MNLVNCSERCRYQQEGWCKLPSGSPVSVSASKGNGCSYYVPAAGQKTAGSKQKTAKTPKR